MKKFRSSTISRPYYPVCGNVVHLISGRREYRWRHVVARVLYICELGNRFCVVVAASSEDATSPTEHDVANAKLTAAVVSRQIRFRLSRKPISVYLKYRSNTQLEIELDIRSVLAEAREHLKQSREIDSDSPLPTPVLAYLMHRSS